MRSQTLPVAGQVQNKGNVGGKLPLRVSSHVVELEIAGIRPAETYDKEITCDIIDSAKANRLDRIPEDDEYGRFQDDFDQRFESMQRQVSERMPRKSSSGRDSHF